MLQAQIRKKGYVSGIARRSFLDKKTGARDVGFGLHIMDFLLGPGWKDDGYTRDPKVHGDLPKHYVEGPQICTQAKELKPEVIEGKDFVAVGMQFRFTKAAKGYKAGSLWEQTLVFQPGVRYVSWRRADHQRQRRGQPLLPHRHARPHQAQEGRHVRAGLPELSRQPIPAPAFTEDFAPDDKFLYQRNEDKVPERMIRAYQVKVDGKPGPWLAGMTLDPAARRRGVVPSARLRLLHPGAARQEGEGRRDDSAPRTSSAISTTLPTWRKPTISTRACGPSTLQ